MPSLKYYQWTTMFLSILLCFLTHTSLLAKAIPIAPKTTVHQKKSSKKRAATRYKMALKQYKKPKYTEPYYGYRFPFLILIPIAWYVIAFSLLAIGLALAIPAIWITAVVLLLLPIVVALVLFIVFLISMNNTAWE